ncbi:MAG: hypothetical protein JWQ81_5937 [Amycolatopsis sp.]|uniref:hypothetical protein n=1 Tax=Amycolatopsis sp. TaxID=37632 RepID=UPI002622BED0|nr:hypothetical protein [Amycolatopsis sp.]MCU1685198.1 hypothetical protein [Amycolatopsis sp.]
MTAILESPFASEGAAAADPFALHVILHTDVASGDLLAPCGTADGCDPTCASSCANSSGR